MNIPSLVLRLSSFAAALIYSTASWPLAITSTTTSADDLVDVLLGTGVSVDYGSINYIGVTDQSGFFSGGLASGLGFDSGILMTTGNVNDAVGPNALTNNSTTVGTGPDPDLDAIISVPGGQPPSTYDKAVLEFSFTTTGGSLFFNFQFASGEYNE